MLTRVLDKLQIKTKIMENNSKVFLAALTGAVIGAGIALLLAPANGKETREKLADKLGDAKEAIKEKGKEAIEKVKSYS